MAKTEKGGLRAGRPYLSTRRSIPEWRTKSRNFCRASTDPSVRGSTRLSESSGLGEGLAEEGEHAVAGNVAEGRQLQRVVAAMKREGAGICVVAAEGGEHLLGPSGEERRGGLALRHEGARPPAHDPPDLRPGAHLR